MGPLFFVQNTPSYLIPINLPTATRTTYQAPYATGVLLLGWCANWQKSPSRLFLPPYAADHIVWEVGRRVYLHN